MNEEQFEETVTEVILEGAEKAEIHPDDANPLLKITDLEVTKPSLDESFTLLS